MQSRQAESTMAQRILDTAEELVQSRGFNGFSYAHLASRLHVTKASLHYHFASKGLLGEELITRYTANFGDALDGIDASGADATDKLAAYVALYRDVVNNDRVCLCGMLAAEAMTLEAPMRDALLRFFDLNEAWLAAVLSEGDTDGTVRLNGSATDTARLVVGGLEGAMLMARPFGDPQRFHTAADSILAGITAGVRV